MQKILHKTGLIEIGAQQAAAANLGYNSFFSSHKFTYVFIWDAIKRLRKLNVGEGNDDSDSDDFQSVLDVDEHGTVFCIAQFDKYIWRSSALEYLNLYDYASCITHRKVKNKSHDREPISSAGRERLRRYPFEGCGCKFRKH